MEVVILILLLRRYHPNFVRVLFWSILGPFLYTIFIDSVCNLPLSNNSKLALYADNIVLYKPINSSCDILAFQQDVDQILLWTTNHGLTLNTSKTCALPITRSPKPISLNL